MAFKRVALRVTAAAATLTAGAVLAACGSSGSNTASGSQATPPSAAPKPTINVGYFPDISPVALMMQQKTLEKEGYKVTWTEFLKGVPQEAAAMVSGAVDIIWANTSASIAVFQKDPGLAYLIGQSITNDNQVVVPAGSPIANVSQIEGKTISSPGALTAPQLVLDIAMSKAGANPANVNIIQAGGPQQIPVMQQKAVAAAVTYLPFGAQMALNGGKIIETADQALGAPFPGGGFVASKTFAVAHPAAVVAFLKAANTAENQLKGNTAAYYQNLATFADTTAAAISYSFANKLVAFAPLLPNMTALTKVAQAEEQFGFVPSGTDLVSFLHSFVNSSFAKQAAK